MDLTETRIIACEAKEPYKVWIKFIDGVEGIVDLSDLLSKKVFAEAWSTKEKFMQVHIDPDTKTLTWGKEGDTVDVNRISLKQEVLKSSDCSLA